ncbi:MAG TPA: hypothetical protein VGW78_07345 [Candidatus Babeliales bacterium]|nr:hypothetical protein [Candidatus Babeliales bacterium]
MKACTIIKINVYMLLAASLSCYGIVMNISIKEEQPDIPHITISGTTNVATYWGKPGGVIELQAYEVTLNFNQKQMTFKVGTKINLERNLDKEEDLDKLDKIKNRINKVLEEVSPVYSEAELTYTIPDIAKNSYAWLLYADLTALLKKTMLFAEVRIEVHLPFPSNKSMQSSWYAPYVQSMKNSWQSWKNWFAQKKILGTAVVGTGLTLGGLYYWYNYYGKK